MKRAICVVDLITGVSECVQLINAKQFFLNEACFRICGSCTAYLSKRN